MVPVVKIICGYSHVLWWHAVRRRSMTPEGWPIRHHRSLFDVWFDVGLHRSWMKHVGAFIWRAAMKATCLYPDPRRGQWKISGQLFLYRAEHRLAAAASTRHPRWHAYRRAGHVQRVVVLVVLWSVPRGSSQHRVYDGLQPVFKLLSPGSGAGQAFSISLVRLCSL